MVGRSDSGHSGGIRDLRHQPTFELSAQAIGISVAELDDMLLGVTFTIARIPDVFPVVAQDSNGNELFVARYTGNPPLLVWFSYSDTTVDLWFVTRAQPDAS